jgi:hypothetical protein
VPAYAGYILRTGQFDKGNRHGSGQPLAPVFFLGGNTYFATMAGIVL